MVVNSPGLNDATPEQIADALAGHIAQFAAAGLEGTAEDLLKRVLKGAGVPPRFLDYWNLGDFIQDQVPYFRTGEGKLIYDANGKLDPAKIKIAGRLQANNASNVFPTGPTAEIPKPPSYGGPEGPPKSFFFRIGRDSGELGPGSPFGDNTMEDEERLERNIIKVIEIEYGPEVVEKDQTKPPHLIILMGGGDHKRKP
jgi:hypothetical protein